MTTTYHYQRRYNTSGRKNDVENKKLFLFSPFALLALVTLVFVFFLAASNESGYLRSAMQTESEINKDDTKPDPAVMYKKIVTNADAIRSVLQ
jgi:hypothetical protein